MKSWKIGFALLVIVAVTGVVFAAPIRIGTKNFTEQFVERNGGEEMVFDYVLRHGVAKSSNALKMLQMLDLAEAE